MSDTLWSPRIFTTNGFVKDNIVGDIRALDVGCGGRKLLGAVGMDSLKLSGVDVVHNIDSCPWPFKDDSFDLVLMNHSLEHAQDIIKTLEETHRILNKGGRVVIQVPYFRCVDAYNDPTHKHFFTARTLDYIIKDSGLSKYKYTNKLFTKKGFWYGWPHSSKNPFVRVLKSFIHKHSDFYDQYLSLIVSNKCLTWELEAVK